jgi:peptidyl-prolyl cis-trans isomerase C
MQCVRVIGLAAVCIALVAWAAGCGCGSKEPPSTAADARVIATLDGQAIDAERLIEEYETVPSEHRTRYAANRRELLDFIINRMVIAAEAGAAGLDKDPKILREMEDARRFALRMLLDREMMEAGPPITDEQLRARYREDVLGPFGPAIVTQAIVYRIPVEPAGAEAILKTIRVSRDQHLPFGTLATRDQLPFEVAPTPLEASAAFPAELVTELETMLPFTATDVRTIDGTGCLFYKEPLPFEQAEPVVRAAVVNEQIAKTRQVWLDSVRSTAKVAAYPERFTGEAADTDVLATVNGAVIAVGDARRALERMAAPLREHHAGDAGGLVEELVTEELLVQEALRRGLDGRAEFAAHMARATEAILVRAMRERVLAELEVTITEDELRRLATEAAGGDLPTEFIELHAIINTDRAQVAKALEELKGGFGFDEVHATYSSEKNQHLGTYSDTTLDQMPDVLRTAVAALKDGEYTDVLELDGRFCVVRVSRRPAIVDLESWRHQLLDRKQDELFLAWVVKQRAKHRIAVNTERLDAVELPAVPAGPPAPTGLRIIEDPTTPEH